MGCERKRTKRVLRFCPEQLKLTYSYVAKTKRGAGVEEGKGDIRGLFQKRTIGKQNIPIHS